MQRRADAGDSLAKQILQEHKRSGKTLSELRGGKERLLGAREKKGPLLRALLGAGFWTDHDALDTRTGKQQQQQPPLSPRGSVSSLPMLSPRALFSALMGGGGAAVTVATTTTTTTTTATATTVSAAATTSTTTSTATPRRRRQRQRQRRRVVLVLRPGWGQEEMSVRLYRSMFGSQSACVTVCVCRGRRVKRETGGI